MTSRLAALVAILAVVAFAAAAQADVTLATWDNSPDNSKDWTNGLSIDDPSNMPGRYSYTTHNGSPGLLLTEPSWRQSLALDLPWDLRDDFLANDTLLIDLTVFATEGTTSGFTKIEQILLNAEGISWGDIEVDAPYFKGWGAPGEESTTLAFDYSAYLPVAAGIQASEGRTPNWIQIVITTNGGDSANTGNFIFQNARCIKTIPEPASIALLGLGLGLLLVRRRR
jgi:hypothetical protein